MKPRTVVGVALSMVIPGPSHVMLLQSTTVSIVAFAERAWPLVAKMSL